MKEEELKALMGNVDKAIADAITKSNGSNAEALDTLKETLETLKTELDASKEADKTEDIVEQIEKLAADVKALKEPVKHNVNASPYNQIVEQLKGVKDLVKSGQSKGLDIKLTIEKAAGTMTTGNVTPTTPGGLSMLLNDFTPGITPIPRTQPFFLDLFRRVPTTGNTVSYAEMKNPDGGAGMTGEGAAKTQADFDIVEAKADVKKVTAYIKTSKEALSDIEGLAGEINGELTTLVNLKADSQAMVGDGTGNNLNGVITVAPTFTGGALAGLVEAANYYDVLVAGITEVQVAEVVAGEPAGFLPDTIVMNPNDVALMNLTKDLNDNYIFPIAIAGKEVMMVPIISNARMTSGDFLIMDSTKVNYRDREAFNISVGYENDDFTKNLITILGERRLTVYVKSNHVKALLTGTFTTAAALLETV